MSNIEYQTQSHIQILNVEYRISNSSHIQILNVEYQTKSNIQIECRISYRISNSIQHLIIFFPKLLYIKLNQTFRSKTQKDKPGVSNIYQSYIQILNRLLHCALCKTLFVNASGMVIYVSLSGL